MKDFKSLFSLAIFILIFSSTGLFSQTLWIQDPNNTNDIYNNTSGTVRILNNLRWNNTRSFLSTDQGGSIELGDGLGHSPSMGPGGNVADMPYIDFHWGLNNTTQDYNYRIINESNNLLSFYNGSQQKVVSFTNNALRVFNNGNNSKALEFGMMISPYNYGYIGAFDPGGQDCYLQLGGKGVGIGTGNTPPLQDFDVAGRMRLGNGVIQNGGTAITNTSDLGLYSQQNGWHIRIVSNQAPIRFFTDANTNLIGGTATMVVHNNGSVGIGTENPDASYKLSVNGKIRSKEIKVEANWSDFVFKTDYKLNSLEEVEKYIKDNGHLSDIPSEQEVTENGVELGDMTSKLLQKVEELTLYVIEQKKEIQILKDKLNSK